jgi:heme-degrading monooxygenase HmoA
LTGSENREQGLRESIQIARGNGRQEGFDMTSSQLPTFGWGTTPQPPYYVVIFTYQRTEGDQGYDAMAQRMGEAAQQQPGFLAVETMQGADGVGVVLVYWKDTESIIKWKHHLEHLSAQKLGRERWYKSYRVRVAKVERAYGFDRTADSA